MCSKFKDYLKSLKKKCENFLVKALELQLNTFFNEYTKLHTHITQDLYANYEKIYEKNKIQSKSNFLKVKR